MAPPKKSDPRSTVISVRVTGFIKNALSRAASEYKVPAAALVEKVVIDFLVKNRYIVTVTASTDSVRLVANTEIIERAQELATRHGDDRDWARYLQEARSQLESEFARTKSSADLLKLLNNDKLANCDFDSVKTLYFAKLAEENRELVQKLADLQAVQRAQDDATSKLLAEIAQDVAAIKAMPTHAAGVLHFDETLDKVIVSTGTDWVDPTTGQQELPSVNVDAADVQRLAEFFWGSKRLPGRQFKRKSELKQALADLDDRHHHQEP